MLDDEVDERSHRNSRKILSTLLESQACQRLLHEKAADTSTNGKVHKHGIMTRNDGDDAFLHGMAPRILNPREGGDRSNRLIYAGRCCSHHETTAVDYMIS